MTQQQIFDTSARGLILQGCKSAGTGQMYGHSYIDEAGNRCALGFLVPCKVGESFRSTQAITRDLNIVCATYSVRQHPLALELMRIHNCCEVVNWPALLTACAKQFNLNDSVISEALAEVAQRAVGTEVRSLEPTAV